MWGAVSGVGGAVGILSLYRGLAIDAGIVSPIAAVGAAGLPVLADVLGGQAVGLSLVSGIVLGLASILLVSRQPSDATGSAKPAIVAGAGAALGLGFMLIALGQVGEDAGIWPLLPSRVVSASLVAALAVWTAQPLLLRGRPAVLAAIAGIGSALANGLFILAVQRGSLAASSVLLSMFPAVTVLLARVFLNQRLSRDQIAGLVGALGAISLISVG